MYSSGLNKNDMFVCETIDRNITATTHDFYPNVYFMGARKNSPIMNEFIDFAQRIISTDYTTQSAFLGDFDRWCNSRVNKNRITMIPAKMTGTSTMDDTQVLIDDLMSSSYIPFYKGMYGIYIPSDEILKRTNYQWFARLSPKQVLESNTIIGKYMLIANKPKSNVVETMKSNNKKPTSWIGYWQVPSGFSLWGMKPTQFAAYVPRQTTQPPKP